MMLMVGLPEQASSFFSQVHHFSLFILFHLFHHRTVSEVQTHQLILEQLRDTRVIIIGCQNIISSYPEVLMAVRVCRLQSSEMWCSSVCWIGVSDSEESADPH